MPQDAEQTYNEMVKNLKEKDKPKEAQQPKIERPAPPKAGSDKPAPLKQEYKPRETKEFDSSWGQKFFFTMPSAADFKQHIPNRRVHISGDGGLFIEIADLERLVDAHFVSPAPDLNELTQGQYMEVLLAFRAFLGPIS